MIPRTCARCELFMYDDRPGEMGPPTMLESGKQMPRPVGCPTPCHQCPKVPSGAPERTRKYAIDPTEKSMEAIRHYQQCQAIRRVPLDAIVERNAGLILPIEQEAEVVRTQNAAGLIALLLSSGGKRA